MNDAIPVELRDELAGHNVRRLVDPRSLPVRFSRLRNLARSPRHYLESCLTDRPDTLALRMGRGSHAATFGQPIAIWDGVTDSGRARPRSGKDWELFRAEHAGAEILNAKEYAAAKALADSLRRHERASGLIYSSGTFLEHPIDWTYRGRRCQSHLDVFHPNRYVADLKCVRDSQLDRFARTAIWSHYHAQLAFYMAAAENIGMPVTEAFLIVVENTPPYDVTVRPLTAAALDAGDRLWRQWFDTLLMCERDGVWPGYAQADVPIDAIESSGPLELMFSGEAFEL